MLYPQNDDRFVTIDSVTSLHPVYKERKGAKHTHTHPFNGSLSGTTRVSRYQKGKTSLDFTAARDSECPVA